ncbi:hypothetical protein B484DRAFT_441452, partial [Ochromonadaceae sp. CCMP2298]
MQGMEAGGFTFSGTFNAPAKNEFDHREKCRREGVCCYHENESVRKHLGFFHALGESLGFVEKQLIKCPVCEKDREIERAKREELHKLEMRERELVMELRRREGDGREGVPMVPKKQLAIAVCEEVEAVAAAFGGISLAAPPKLPKRQLPSYSDMVRDGVRDGEGGGDRGEG